MAQGTFRWTFGMATESFIISWVDETYVVSVAAELSSLAMYIIIIWNGAQELLFFIIIIFLT